MQRFRVATLLSTCVAFVGAGACGSSQTRPTPPRAPRPGIAHWRADKRVRAVVDLGAPYRGRTVVLAAAGRLALLGPGGVVRAFAPSYSAPSGLEPYIAVSLGQRLPKAQCRFPQGSIYALRLGSQPGITVIDVRGNVRQFARLSGRGLENGIAFDGTGKFGHRLLVTSTSAGKSTIFAIDCRGHVEVLTRSAPRLEGGIVVAPVNFGRLAGALIAPDELSGRLYAIGPDGAARLALASGLPHGQDVGVESAGFVPARYSSALVADRRTPRNPHPGDDLILGLPRATLSAAGVYPGDLLAVTEGGAGTVAVTCTTTCRVRHIADGPRGAHVEGHVVFSPAG